jgi:hypothetical protein
MLKTKANQISRALLSGSEGCKRVKIFYVLDNKRVCAFPAKHHGSPQKPRHYEVQIILWDEWLWRVAYPRHKKAVLTPPVKTSEEYGKVTT